MINLKVWLAEKAYIFADWLLKDFIEIEFDDFDNCKGESECCWEIDGDCGCDK